MADLKNIALTVEAGQTIPELRRSTGIEDQMDLIRLGFAYALKLGLSPDRDAGVGTRGGSNYDTGGIDPDGLMAASVVLFCDSPEACAEPYRAVEVLMSKGLRRLQEDWRSGVVGSLSDLVSDAG